MPKIELFSVGSFLVLGQQLLIGIALGLMTQFLMESFVMAGQSSPCRPAWVLPPWWIP